MQIITLKESAYKESCFQLFSSFETKFDLVVGISRGGTHILNSYKTYNKGIETQYKIIKLKDTNKKDYKKNKITQRVIKYLPYWLLNKLRIYEVKQKFKKIKHGKPQSILKFNCDNLDKKNIRKILVLDDAIDSGVTMALAIRSLEKNFPDSKIMSAVIAWTNCQSVSAPNYYLYKEGLVRFPWSMDYKEKSNE